MLKGNRQGRDKMIKIIDCISRIMAVLLGIGVPSLYRVGEEFFNTRPDQFMGILILLWITTHLGLFLAPTVREKGIICRVIVAILMLPSTMWLLGSSIGYIIIGGIVGIYRSSWSIEETVGFICGFVPLSMGLIIYITQYNLLFRGILFKPIYLRRLIVRERKDICTGTDDKSVSVPMELIKNRKGLKLIVIVLIMVWTMWLMWPLVKSLTYAERYGFVTKWGGKGKGNGQFDNPVEVAVDSKGYVYVTDTWNYRIQKFSSTGEFITKWGSFGNGDGQFKSPVGIAVDSKDYVYVIDGCSHCIQKFSSTGEFITKWGSFGNGDGQFKSPVGIAVDSKDYVYVIDGCSHCIQKFSSTGEFITKWGSKGEGDGQFNNPVGVAVDSKGYVYVIDYRPSRIQKFSSTGKFITKWGSFGNGDGQFKYPVGVTVDSKGYVYVSDIDIGSDGPCDSYIQKFSSSGKFITKWGGSMQVRYPNGVAVDSKGYVYVVDKDNHCIKKFRKKIF